MTGTPRISLEQWRSLLAVVDAGGYAQAAEILHKSQSAITYAVQKMETLLGVKVFEVVGRKAHLTPTGQVLYRRAKALLEEAGALEGAAGNLAAGWEPELRLAVEIIFPTWLLLRCFARFAEERPQTRIELYETVLSGTEEALVQRKVDLAICSQVPPGFAGDPLIRLRFIVVAHPDHPLHQLGRELTLQDLRKHRQLVIRDTGSQRRSGNWLGAEQSWTVSQKATSIHAAGMGLVAPDGRWIQVNRSLCEMLGYSEAELLAGNFRSITHPDDLSVVLEQLRKLHEGTISSLQLEQRYLHKNLQLRWVLLSVTTVNDAQNRSANLIFQMQDITDRKQAEEKLVHDAFHDALTGLPNRILFMDHLKQSVLRAKRRKHFPFAVLFLDFDRFKLINDSLGHMVGDQLLIAIASRLGASVRPGDTVARLGGDEFTILLDDLNGPDEAIVVVRRLLRNLAEPFRLAGREVFITASVGVALSTTGYEHAEDLLRDADTAMYRAKSLGKARYEVFDKTMHANATDLLQIETDLWRALERKELTLDYQPIVSLRTGRIAGFEALLRWLHPARGMVSPLEFISVAEETGLIVPIGQWVLDQACRQTREWQKRYPQEPPLHVSVNLSAKQFMQPDLIDQVSLALDRSGLNPANLKVEITESMVMQNVESTTRMLGQLRALGVEISIDDFGTGYSSLSYLHRFPISALKVDRSFVSSMIDNQESLEIVRTIVALARNLKMDVVAEGVETLEQAEELRSMNCEFGQGYYFSRALNAENAVRFLAGDSADGIPPPAVDSLVDYEHTLIA